MNQQSFVSLLTNATNRLTNREKLIAAAINNPEFVALLLTNMEAHENEISTFSARILELACKEKLGIITPYLDQFCNIILKIKQPAVIRASSKICELLIHNYFTKYPEVLKEKNVEKIIEASFDWMISNQKTAVKAYTMHTLYLLGTKYQWIHPELVLNIQKDIPTATTGYINRGRKVIKAIETGTKLKL